MIKFLELKKITDRYSSEIHEAVSRVIDSGWYLQGKENEKFEALIRDIKDINSEAANMN